MGAEPLGAEAVNFSFSSATHRATGKLSTLSTVPVGSVGSSALPLHEQYLRLTNLSTGYSCTGYS